MTKTYYLQHVSHVGHIVQVVDARVEERVERAKLIALVTVVLSHAGAAHFMMISVKQNLSTLVLVCVQKKTKHAYGSWALRCHQVT